MRKLIFSLPIKKSEKMSYKYHIFAILGENPMFVRPRSICCSIFVELFDPQISLEWPYSDTRNTNWRKPHNRINSGPGISDKCRFKYCVTCMVLLPFGSKKICKKYCLKLVRRAWLKILDIGTPFPRVLQLNWDTYSIATVLESHPGHHWPT